MTADYLDIARAAYARQPAAPSWHQILGWCGEDPDLAALVAGLPADDLELFAERVAIMAESSDEPDDVVAWRALADLRRVRGCWTSTGPEPLPEGWWQDLTLRPIERKE